MSQFTREDLINFGIECGANTKSDSEYKKEYTSLINENLPGNEKIILRIRKIKNKGEIKIQIKDKFVPQELEKEYQMNIYLGNFREIEIQSGDEKGFDMAKAIIKSAVDMALNY